MQLKEKEKESEVLSQVWRKELAVIKEAKELNEKIEITKMKAAKAQVYIHIGVCFVVCYLIQLTCF